MPGIFPDQRGSSPHHNAMQPARRFAPVQRAPKNERLGVTGESFPRRRALRLGSNVRLAGATSRKD